MFLDISKALDKVWHEGIIHNFKRNGIPGKLLSLLTDYLRNRKQKVILNGQSSSWANINAWVPQGSILGPLLFLIYINDLSDNFQYNPKLFADHTSLISTVKVPERTVNNLNNNLTLQSKLKRSFLAERVLRKFTLKYFSIIFQLVKPIPKNIWACI